MEIIGFVLIFLVGLILGLVGGGGSLLAIPILIYIFSLDVITASSYSLFLIAITCAVGTALRYKNHTIDVNSGILFGLPSIISLFLTRWLIIPELPEIIFQFGTMVLSKRLFLLSVFSMMIVMTSIPMILRKGDQDIRIQNKKSILLIFLGLIIGFVTGLVGIGGGFIILPVLFLVAKLPFQKAVGTSIFIIFMKSAIGFLGDLFHYQPDWLFLLMLSSISVLGIFSGIRISAHINTMKLKTAFGWLLLFIGISVITKELHMF